MHFSIIFWTYFHKSISSNLKIRNTWPPKHIILLNPHHIPLLHLIILISSGFTITSCHNIILKNKLFQRKFRLIIIIIIILKIYFSLLQIFEYFETSYRYNDRIYGSINFFFKKTGFREIHVNIGILFLSTYLVRLINKHSSKIHHFHFEAAAWY